MRMNLTFSPAEMAAIQAEATARGILPRELVREAALLEADYIVPPEPEQTPQGTLTPRQAEVYALIVKGHTNREIALMLGITYGTAGEHSKAVKRKMGVTPLDRARYRAGICKAPEPAAGNKWDALARAAEQARRLKETGRALD